MRNLFVIAILQFGGLLATGARGDEFEKTASPERAESPSQTDGLADPPPSGAALRLGSLRLRQGSNITGLAVSPDGRSIATTGSATGAPICVWDSATGRLVASLRNPDDEGQWWNYVAFSLDNKKLAAACCPGIPGVRIWDVATRSLELESVVDGRSLSHLVFSPDGQTIAAFANESRPQLPEQILLLDASTGRKRRGFKLPTHERIPGRLPGRKMRELEPPAWISAIRFSANGRFLAAVGGHRTVFVWDLGFVWDLRAADNEPLLLAEQDGTAGDFVAVNFLPDSSRLLISGYRRIDRAKFPLPVPDPDRQVDAADISVWSLATGRKEREIPIPEPLAGNAWGHSKLSPDGSRVYWPSRRGVEVLDFKTGRVLQTLAGLQEHDVTFAVDLSKDGRIVASADRNAVVLWDSRTGRRLHADLEGHNAPVTDVAFVSGGGRIVTSGRDLALRQWNAGTGRCLGTIRGGLAFAVTRDSRLVAVGRLDGWDRNYRCSLAILDGATGTIVREIPVIVTPPFDENWQVAFSADATLLASSVRAGEIRIFNVADGRELISFHSSGAKTSFHALWFSADRKQLFTACTSAAVDAWDVTSGRHTGQFTAFEQERRRPEYPNLSAAAFAPDAPLISVGRGSSAFSWSLDTGQVVSAVDLPSDKPITRFTFSADGRFAATLEPADFLSRPAFDGTLRTGVGGIVRIWEMASGLPRRSIELPSQEPASFAFSPDNARLATGMTDGTTLVWDWTQPGSHPLSGAR